MYKLGYKTGSKIVHKVTADALIVVARDKIKRGILEDYDLIKEEALELASVKTDELILYFDQERKKRNIFQYSTHEDIKRSKSKTSFERAKIFCNEVLKLL